jgi:hypothetical protein
MPGALYKTRPRVSAIKVTNVMSLRENTMQNRLDGPKEFPSYMLAVLGGGYALNRFPIFRLKPSTFLLYNRGARARLSGH